MWSLCSRSPYPSWGDRQTQLLLLSQAKCWERGLWEHREETPNPDRAVEGVKEGGRDRVVREGCLEQRSTNSWS